jgi:hypothetical protein
MGGGIPIPLPEAAMSGAPAVIWRDGEFRIDHPRHELLDISPEGAKLLPAFDWHSPIYEKAGAGIVEAIWKRVIDGFNK